MRIALVVAKYFQYGGMQRSMRRIAEELIKRGHQLEVFCLQWQGPAIANCTIHQLSINKPTNHGRMKGFSDTWIEASENSNFDLAIGFNKVAGLDIYYAGDPCLASQLAEERPNWIKYLPRYRCYLNLEKAVFRKGEATKILLISHDQKAKFQHHYQTEDERFHLLSPGIQKERLEPAPSKNEIARLRNQLGIDLKSKVLLTIGSGYKTKGVDRVIRAIAALPEEKRLNVHYLVVGEGTVGQMKRLAKKLHVSDRVHFLGAQHNVALYYYSATALIHPARTENTGTTLIEAMICGLPVLTTANCGFSHYVSEANAGEVLPHPFKQDRLSQALDCWLTGNQLEHWAQKGPNYTNQHNFFSLIHDAADIIESANRHDSH